MFEIKFQSQSRKFQWKRQGISRLFSRRTTFLQLKTVKVHLAGTSEKLPFSFQNFHCRLSWKILRLYLYLSIKKILKVQFPWSHYTFRRHCSEIVWEIWKIIFEQFGFYGAIWIHCKWAKMPFWHQIQEIPFLNLQNTQISNIRVPHPIFSIEKNLAYKSNWAQFLCCSYFLDLETAYCQNYIYHTDNISIRYHMAKQCPNVLWFGSRGAAMAKLIPWNVLFNLGSGICLSWELESFLGLGYLWSSNLYLPSTWQHFLIKRYILIKNSTIWPQIFQMHWQ